MLFRRLSRLGKAGAAGQGTDPGDLFHRQSDQWISSEDRYLRTPVAARTETASEPSSGTPGGESKKSAANHRGLENPIFGEFFSGLCQKRTPGASKRY